MRLLERIIRAIVDTRFIPVETILAIGGFILGLWLLIGGISTIPGVFGVFAAVWLLVIGLAHLYGLSQEGNANRVPIRRWTSFFEFLNFTYIAILLLMEHSYHSFGWFAFHMLSLVAATGYLSLTLEHKFSYEKER